MNVALSSNPSPHTPGPWGLEATEDNLLIYFPAPIGMKVLATIGTGFDEPFESQQWANAHLMRAAPDLLALAKQYASECSGCDGEGRRIVTFNDREAEYDPCEDCADIRAVIDKAEGRA